MNIALYIRLSKEDEQSGESKSITSQRMCLQNYIKCLDYQNVYEYVDDGYSGTNFNRPSFKKLLNDIESNKVNTIITKDSSRLGRNISWVTFYLEEYFPSKKIRFIAVDDHYDSDEINSVESELLIFRNLFNDYYCKDISRKIKSSLKAKKIEGKFTGWKAPYGYVRSEDDYHDIVVDGVVSPNVKMIFDLAYHDNTPSAIARILNDRNIQSPARYIGLKNSKWSTKTVKDILINPTYIGNLTQGKRKKINYKLKQSITVPKEDWIIKENTHEAIISKEIYDEVQNKLNKYHNIKNNKVKTKEFINLMYCKECGAKIGLNNRKYQSYCVCNRYKREYHDKKCTPHTYNYRKLKDAIIRELNNEMNNLYSKDKIKKLISDKRNLEKQIIDSEAFFLDLYIQYKSNNINRKEYHNMMLNKEREIDRIRKILNRKIAMIKINMDKNKILSNVDFKKDIYMRMISKIYLSEKGVIEILFNYKSYH